MIVSLIRLIPQDKERPSYWKPQLSLGDSILEVNSKDETMHSDTFYTLSFIFKPQRKYDYLFLNMTDTGQAFIVYLL